MSRRQSHCMTLTHYSRTLRWSLTAQRKSCGRSPSFHACRGTSTACLAPCDWQKAITLILHRLDTLHAVKCLKSCTCGLWMSAVASSDRLRCYVPLTVLCSFDELWGMCSERVTGMCVAGCNASFLACVVWLMIVGASCGP